jgi:hypothetical protein
VPLEDPHTPFQARTDVSLVEWQFYAQAFVQIPPGLQLVAQFISVQVSLPLGQTPFVSFNADSGAVGGYIPVQAAGVNPTSFGSLAVFVAALPILDYATGLFDVELFRIEPDMTQAPGVAFLSAFVSGFTVPV